MKIPPKGYFLLTPNWILQKNDIFWDSMSSTWKPVPEIAFNEDSTIYEYVARQLPKEVEQSMNFDWNNYRPTIKPANFSPTKLFIDKYRMTHKKLYDHEPLQAGDIYLDVYGKESEVSPRSYGNRVGQELPGRTVLRKIGW